MHAFGIVALVCLSLSVAHEWYNECNLSRGWFRVVGIIFISMALVHL